MKSVSTTEVRESIAEYVNEVAYGKERVILKRHGKEVAALIPIEDLRLLERVEVELGDRLDLEETRKALIDPGNRKRLPWSAVKKSLGL